MDRGYYVVAVLCTICLEPGWESTYASSIVYQFAEFLDSRTRKCELMRGTRKAFMSQSITNWVHPLDNPWGLA